MSNTPFFDQAEKNITTLLLEKKYNQAYEACKRYIDKFPGEKFFIKLKEKIENEVKEENKRITEEKIKEAEDLFKKENYEQILKNLEPLLKVDPGNKKLKKTIIKAQEAYKKKFELIEREYVENQRKRLNNILQNENFLLLDELFVLEKNNFGNKNVQKLVQEFRDKFIDKKIEEKEKLIYSDKYNAINNFLDQLKKINKKNPRVKEIERRMKQKRFSNFIDEKKEFIYEAVINLKTLIRLNKYDKAIKVANEILAIEKNNEEAIKVLKKAQKQFFKQTREETINFIIKKLPKLKEDYLKNKNVFVKI